MRELPTRIPKEEMPPYQFLGDIYNYIDTHPQFTVPIWIECLDEGSEFRAINTIDYGYRYIDYSLISEGIYNSKTNSSRILLDQSETIYRNGIYKVVTKNEHPNFISFDKRKLVSPPELKVTLIEEIQRPNSFKTTKYLIAFLNNLI